MKKELTYFNIDDHYGGNQNWFIDPMMKLGGCAAVTACDLCVYLNILKNSEHLYPFDVSYLKKADYIKFSHIMKPYLRPRMTGINTLQLYIDGFGKYLEDVNDKEIKMTAFSGDNSLFDGEKVIINQINKDIPIPFLLLKHKNAQLKELVWHWFLIVGYEKTDNELSIKIATYGGYNWISFKELWNTGYEEKGGMIIIEMYSN
ncbi:hypothetical protein [Terrisporobacter mayombei]|uniref:Peptidase C39-like domain-containing protein n=1 Tax=Terrisporobacter mayombei TaxID=1541 RepID=A0ABY9Q0H4_9FIRM|nr:hypothetical protein [Terrisporobacter mayombei]MCC3867211.1 hypothetical protein [Terrisporobacter mayombei]WMT81473.1 hypothetical protein TEMA_18140 [Terrisporobacter mayombei]